VVVTPYGPADLPAPRSVSTRAHPAAPDHRPSVTFGAPFASLFADVSRTVSAGAGRGRFTCGARVARPGRAARSAESGGRPALAADPETTVYRLVKGKRMGCPD
jgi:hypothetical protein